MYIYSPEAAPDSGVFGSVVSSRSKLRLHTLIRTPRTSYKLTFAHPPLSRVNPTHLSLRVYIYICIHRYSYIGIYIYIYIYIYSPEAAPDSGLLGSVERRRYHTYRYGLIYTYVYIYIDR